MRRVYLPLLFLALLAFASTASACEVCKSWFGETTCWSGEPKGAQWCYGGWGTECQSGGTCPEEPPFEWGAVEPPDTVCASGPLGCSEVSPAGFALDRATDAAPARERAAMRSDA
jgi:hypothetical protein